MLTSIDSPNAVHRSLWANRLNNTPNYSTSRNLMDVVYAGITKIGQNSDIMLSRYMALTPTDLTNASPALNQNDLPSRAAQPLPRVYRQANIDQNLVGSKSSASGVIRGEELQKDPQYGYYTAQHLAWIRPDPALVQNGTYNWGPDNWDGYATTPAGLPSADFPYIHVVLGDGYNSVKLPNGSTASLPIGTIVSGTDGSIKLPNGSWEVQPPSTPAQAIVPTVDAATGIYTYTYTDTAGNPTLTASVLGQMLVNYSSGIVRFTQPFKEIKESDGSYSTTNVYAQYHSSHVAAHNRPGGGQQPAGLHRPHPDEPCGVPRFAGPKVSNLVAEHH